MSVYTGTCMPLCMCEGQKKTLGVAPALCLLGERLGFLCSATKLEAGERCQTWE